MKTEDYYYAEAIKRFINYSTNDATAIIAHENGLLGMTRMIACMDYLKIPYEDIYMLALPDFTYTRNSNRWNSGFPYGCIISLPKVDTPFIPIDFRPNCCGVIFAKISQFTDSPESLREKYSYVLEKYTQVDSSDLNRRNHFLALYKNIQTNEYYCLLHCSFKFVKRILYSEHNPFLEDIRTFNYLSEDFHYLLGDSAKKYYETYIELEQKTLFLRKMIIESLFDHATIIFNKTHEGFLGIDKLLLGAYADHDIFEYPLMLSPETNLYVIDVKKSIQIGNKEHLYCGPHGGGYTLASVIDATKMKTDDILNREYMLRFPNDCLFVTNNVLDMPFNYRSNTMHEWCIARNMAYVKEELLPLINFKV